MNKLIGILMTIVVGVIMVGSVLVPSLTDTEDSMHDTFTNTASADSGIATWERFIVDGDDDMTCQIRYTDNYSFIINGETINTYTASGSFITTDQCRLVKNGGYFQMFDSTGIRLQNFSMATANIDITYTASTGEFTVTTYTDLTNTEVANTYTYTVDKYIVYLSPHGDYLATYLDGNNSVYVTSNVQIVSGGAYTTGDLDTSYFAQGETVSVGNSSYTGSATLNTQSVDGYVGLLSGTTQTVSITDGTNTETFTPYTAYVPETVTAISEQNDTYIDLMGVIPVMLIVGLFATAVFVMFRTRD